MLWLKSTPPSSCLSIWPLQLPCLTPQDIAGCNPDASLALHPDNIIVHDNRFSYGKGKANPVDSVTFYRDPSDRVGMKMPRHKVSHMLPVVFCERVIRVYSKDRDDAVVAATQQAFRRCLRKYL